jgi:NAD(P)-dependent dehydrogenase (short-subunit alcohol dehydrogenase family)
MKLARLEGRVAIVTGAAAAGGIGAACARRLAAEGAKIVVADLDGVGAAEVAAQINDAGGTAVAHVVDLANEASIVDLFTAARSRYGAVHIVHNNAADQRLELLGRDQLIGELEVSVWDSTFAVNARGTMLMTKAAIGAMLAAGGGVIINTTSGSAARGDIYNAAYAASTAAIESLTRYVAMQYGKKNIRCNCVAPGLIATARLRATFDPVQANIINRQTLVPFEAGPDDIAGTVAYLASDDSRYVTGQTLAVDGGVLCHMPHAVDMAEFIAAQAASDKPTAWQTAAAEGKR